MGGGVRCAVCSVRYEVLAVREVTSRVAILVLCHALGERATSGLIALRRRGDIGGRYPG